MLAGRFSASVSPRTTVSAAGISDRRLGVAESRHRDLLALRDQGSEREDELPGQVRPRNRELALIVIRVDDLEADPAGAGDRENEFAAGTGHGPRAGRTVLTTAPSSGWPATPTTTPLTSASGAWARSEAVKASGRKKAVNLRKPE